MKAEKGTYQSVRSMATYIAPMENITWNHEYCGNDFSSQNVVGEDRAGTAYIVSCPRTLIIPLFTLDVIIIFILVVIFVESGGRDGAVNISDAYSTGVEKNIIPCFHSC